MIRDRKFKCHFGRSRPGLELESYFDGVLGIGRTSSQVTPPIAPGGSFVARMTPPRAGAFIYHTQWRTRSGCRAASTARCSSWNRPRNSIGRGNGVLLVSAGETWWTTTEFVLNGSRTPDPMEASEEVARGMEQEGLEVETVRVPGEIMP
jgi:hypothetical protein